MGSSRTFANAALSLVGLVTLAGGLAVGCLHGNNAPSRAVDVRVTETAGGYDVAWASGRLVEIRVGRCVADCSEEAPSDPTSEFSELVPAPELAEPLLWQGEDAAGLASPLRLGATPSSATWIERTPYTAPTGSDGLVGVYVIVEQDRGDGFITAFGAATLP